MSTQIEPKLGKPGAGLPWPQKWILRLLVPRMARRSSWQESAKLFAIQGGKIQVIIKDLDAKSMQTQVLVPKLTGLEDSSRFWSIAMTLEHLIIVSNAMADIIVLLSQGKTPPFTVDTAQVKPKKAYDAEAAKKEFSQALERITARLATEVKDKDSPTTHAHPWFGQFSARQWYWLLGSHLGIHKNQIKEILKKL